MRKSVIKNYFYNSGYQLLALLVPLITTPYVSRVLGADNIGIYEYIYSIGQYFVLFGCLGLNLYGQREIAYCRDNYEKRSTVYSELLIIRAVTMGCTIILYLITAQFSQYKIYYYYSLFTLLASLIDISWLYQGLEDFKVTVLRNATVKVLGVIVILTFVKSKDDLWIYFLSHSLTLLIGNATIWFHKKRYVSFHWAISKNIIKHVKGTVSLFIPQIAASVYTVLDKTMLGYFASTIQVGYYSQSEKIVKVVMTIVTSMGVVMLPRISRLFAEKKEKAIEDSIYKSMRFVYFISSPIIFGLIAIVNVFVPWFYGSGYDAVKILIPILSPIIMAIGLSNVVGTQYLVPAKKQKEYTISICCGSVVNLILNALLIGKYQAIGVSIATVCAECTVTGIQLYFVRKNFSIKKMFAPIWRYLVSAAAMLFILRLVQTVLPDGAVGIVISCLMGACIYVLILLALKDAFLIEQLNTVFKRRK